MPDATIIVDQAGRVVLANARAEGLFGYQPGELLGRPVEVLMPERFRQRHAGHHAAFFVSPRVRQMGHGLELYGRRKDGSEFPADISLNPIRAWDRMLVCSSICDISERRVLEAQLANAREEAERASRERMEERYRQLFNEVPVGLYRTTRDGRFVDANAELARILGYPRPEELLGVHVASLYADPADRGRLLEQLRTEGVARGFETRLRRADGAELLVEIRARPVPDDAELLEGSVIDVTQRRALEEQLRQAQKMEAVGQLAGGIAHDFNNLLGAISVFGDLAAGDIPEGDPRRADLDGIRDAVERAKALTRQLLAFSRKQVLSPELLDPNTVISNVLRILGRLIGEDVELITRLDGHAGQVRVDAGQLEQVLVNLAVNARDAMPSGGRLVITTSRLQVEEAEARQHGLERGGDYICIAVSDTGCGMSREVRDRVFEPFFTTKGTKGTGLGLATVYGIVKQSGGHVDVQSEPGAGTVFRICLPRATGVTADTPAVSSTDAPRGGSETVLLAEDDRAVRTAVSTVLTRLGYTVLVTRSAEEAIARASSHKGMIHIVVSDVVMPGLNGRELIEELRRSRPTIKALLTSGYAGDAMMKRGIMDSGLPLIEKPFSTVSLASKVREVLDA